MSVSDRVFRELLDGVLDGSYAPGDKLPTQRALAERLGVNMSGIREAVKRLEELGLLEVRQGDAMRALDWRSNAGPEVIAHLLFEAPSDGRAPIADLMEARRLMLSQAARLAAERGRPEDLAALQPLARMVADAEEAAAAQAADFAFFDALVTAGDNVVFRLIMNSIRKVYFAHAELFSAVVSDHRTLGELYCRAARAVERHDAAEAEQAVLELAGLQEQRLLEALS